MTIRIEADLLIPGRGEPISNGVVVADGGRITFVGESGTAPATPDTTTHNVKVVMPGLWECHGHFVGIEKPDMLAQLTEPVARQAARAVGDLHNTLMGGVTSVREVGGLGLDIAPAIEAGQVSGPTVYGAGRVISTTGGHADIHAIPIDAIHHVEHLGLLADGVPEVMRAVRLNLRRNARVIKICASGGVMSEVDHPVHQQFSHEELVAIVEEAARAERIVAAHCHGKPGIMAALEAGVQTIEHGSFMDEEAADLMVRKGAIYVPTRFVVDQLLHKEDILPPYAYKKGLLVADAQEAAMKLAVAKGVKIAMGTDIFVSGDMYGRNSLEIVFLQNAGMTALAAIEAATATGPETLGPQAPLSGRLLEGYDADIIALDFNPLEDNSLWGNPAHVTHIWKSGTQVKSPTT